MVSIVPVGSKIHKTQLQPFTLPQQRREFSPELDPVSPKSWSTTRITNQVRQLVLHRIDSNKDTKIKKLKTQSLDTSCVIKIDHISVDQRNQSHLDVTTGQKYLHNPIHIYIYLHLLLRTFANTPSTTNKMPTPRHLLLGSEAPHGPHRTGGNLHRLATLMVGWVKVGW